VGKFKPEYAGKMNFYLSILNDTIKLPDENLFVSKYKIVLPTTQELEELVKEDLEELN
jgi:hypothetical protein